MNTPKTQSFFERAQTMGAAELTSPTSKSAPGKITILEMRTNLIRRAEETIQALATSYTLRGFRAPMAKSVRNGVSIKIGYGRRNETLFFDGEKLEPRLFLHQDKYQAVQFLNDAISAINKGEFDEPLQKKKGKYEYRFLSEEEKKKLKEEEKKRKVIEERMRSEKSQPSQKDKQ